MNNESTLFKWTREDGKYVIIENGKLSAHNADDTVINPETDEAADLFIEASIVMRTEMPIATLNDDEDEDFRIRRTIDKQIDYLMSPCRGFGMHHGFMADCMFGGPMTMFATTMFGRHRRSPYLNRDSNDDISDKEYFYKKRKAMMEDFRESRQEEYDRVAKEKQKIIDTAIPYEAPAVCPADLITESNRDYQKQYGSTVITAGHDTENRQLYNIIVKDDNFVLPEHQLEINRITDDCFRIADKGNVYSYFDIRKKQTLFSAPAGKRIFSDINNVLYYETDNNTTVCYDYDGNRLAEFTSDWKLHAIIGGRPVVCRELTEEEQKMLEHINYCKRYMYNIISENGNLMFDQWQFDIYDIKYPNRFTTISQDGICSIYSTEDFSRIYISERPRRIKSNYYWRNSNENLFIFNQTVDFNETETGIIVNVETGEVISKDESGNPRDFEKIEYPNPYNNGKHWKALLSVKTKRMESIDPLTGKRIRNKSKK